MGYTNPYTYDNGLSGGPGLGNIRISLIRNSLSSCPLRSNKCNSPTAFQGALVEDSPLFSGRPEILAGFHHFADKRYVSYFCPEVVGGRSGSERIGGFDNVMVLWDWDPRGNGGKE